jgi:hypothetical protein
MRGRKRSKTAWELQAADYLEDGERLPGLAIVSVRVQLLVISKAMRRECGAVMAQ